MSYNVCLGVSADILQIDVFLDFENSKGVVKLDIEEMLMQSKRMDRVVVSELPILILGKGVLILQQRNVTLYPAEMMPQSIF